MDMRNKYLKPEMKVYEFDSHPKILAESPLIELYDGEVTETDDETLL